MASPDRRNSLRYGRVLISAKLTPAERIKQKEELAKQTPSTASNQQQSERVKSPTHVNRESVGNCRPQPISNKSAIKLTALSFYYTNATSLNNKINELRAVAADSKPDIIPITETWFENQTAQTRSKGTASSEKIKATGVEA